MLPNSISLVETLIAKQYYTDVNSVTILHHSRFHSLHC